MGYSGTRGCSVVASGTNCGQRFAKNLAPHVFKTIRQVKNSLAERECIVKVFVCLPAAIVLHQYFPGVGT
jgi:hypothetical protein